LKGQIAVLDEPEFRRNNGCCDPQFLADFLASKGFAVGTVDAASLCANGTYSGVDVVILPYGPVFPVEARSAFLSYLAGGGHFLSTGGYAFDCLVRKAGEHYEDLSRFEHRRVDLRMNTRYGLLDDHNHIQPDQIGIFQPGWTLKHVHSIRTAPDTPVEHPSVELLLPCEGHIACCSNMGDNSRNYVAPQWEAETIEPSRLPVGRWIPLVNCYDRYGRLRGAAGAMRANYDGPYNGSIWAYFGVENIDLFSAEYPEMLELLARILAFQCQGSFLAPCRLRQWVHDEGDDAELVVHMVNVGKADTTTVDISEYRTGKVLAQLEVQEQRRVGHKVFGLVNWKVAGTEADLIRVTWSLARDGEVIDRLDSGIMIRRQGLLRSGVQFQYRDNYFRVGGRSMFLFGTDNTSRHHVNDSQNPITWWEDALAARDHGVVIFEVLHQQEGVPAQEYGAKYDMSDEQIRSYHGMIQHTQQLGQVYMGGILVGHQVAVDDDELEQARHKVRQYVEHVRPCKAVIYYLNGDYVLSLNDKPFLKGMFNEFLKRKYGSVEALTTAWGGLLEGESWGDIKCFDYVSDDWASKRVEDCSWFKIELMKRWNNCYADLCKELDPSKPVTSEFYPFPLFGIDMPLGIGNQDFSNIGFFADPEVEQLELRGALSLSDLRLYGKSVSLGEFGVHDCPSWDRRNGIWYGHHVEHTYRQKMDLYDNCAHQTLAAGGSRIQSWCLKDDSELCFPWGMMGPNQRIARDQFKLYRNLSWLFRRFPLEYEQPEVAWVVPDYVRLGVGAGRMKDLLTWSADSLQGAGVRFGMINQTRMTEHLPESVSAMVFPLPYILSDEEYEFLKRFVQRGGALYISGDFSYDENRRRTRTGRLAELAGVSQQPDLKQKREYSPLFDMAMGRVVPEPGVKLTEWFANTAGGWSAVDAGTSVLARMTDGQPVLFKKCLGKGFTLFAAAPAEGLSARFPSETASNMARYRRCAPITPGPGRRRLA